MQLKELIDKRVVIVSSVSILFMLCMLIALLATRTQPERIVASAGQKDEVVFSFAKKTLAIDDDDLTVDVMLNTKATKKVSAATITIKYPSDILRFDDSEDASAECAAGNNKLDTVLSVDNNAQTGVVEITRTALLADEELPSGKFCFGTVSFTPVSRQADVTGKAITFDVQSAETLVVGPSVKYTATVDSANGKVTLK
jgi:hypothetical protein